jgi:hypothetical protein
VAKVAVMKKNIFISLSIILFLSSCTGLSTKPSEQKLDGNDSAAAVLLPWSGKHADSDKWTEKLKQEIIRRSLVKLTPSDISTFCPGYAKQDDQGKLVAWMNLFAIMAKYESSYNPKSYYMEPPPLGYHSIGLFQLSYEDQPNYPECALSKSQKNLEDGVTNIKCAVTILSKLVTRDGSISSTGAPYRGGGRYWSVLRPGRNGYKGILAHMKTLKVCRDN